MSVIERVREFLKTRSYNYRRTFKTKEGEKVLIDLAQFCRANETTFLPNQRASDVLNGRREVWLRISHHLNLNPDELVSIYHGKRSEIDE